MKPVVTKAIDRRGELPLEPDAAAALDGFLASLGTRSGAGASALLDGPRGQVREGLAQTIAARNGGTLLTVDLSEPVDTFIGETEKNLSALMELARRERAVLFFDEADALFARRSEVSDAHDRHANLETNFLLQRLEAAKGIVILATNLREELDPVTLRRIRAVIKHGG